MFDLKSGFRFDHSFQMLPPYFYEHVTPSPLKNARLIHVMSDVRTRLGLNQMTDVDLMRWLNSEERVPADQRIATRYAGHQFGVWAGQLGDGRAISLGEIVSNESASSEAARLEVQMKGAGPTPFSRHGDGRAVIRSSVREYLCSIAMKGLGIPTTDVLALIVGDDRVYRETVERSALVARVMASNLRFGHFEMAFHDRRSIELQALIDYACVTFFNGASVDVMLREVIRRTAALIADWQSVGFCHGVMNTDNMSILGLTIDYGPFGFLEDTELSYICNHSDHEGRYAFSHQPGVAHWNLERLLVCFLDLLPKEKLSELLSYFPADFKQAFDVKMNRKLGLGVVRAGDAGLVLELMQLMDEHRLDYTHFFRNLDLYAVSHVNSMGAWFMKYEMRLQLDGLLLSQVMPKLRAINPAFVLRNYIAQEVIVSVEQGETELLSQWVRVLSQPFEDHAGFERYMIPTPPHLKHCVVSCSS